MREAWRQALAIVVALVMVGATITAAGGESERLERAKHTQVSSVYDFDTGKEVPGTAKLIRRAKGVKGVVKHVKATPGHAITWWWVIFNNPEYCSGPCGEDDVGTAFARAAMGKQDPAGVSIVWGAGRVVGKNGHLKMKARLNEGHPGKRQVLVGDGLHDSKTAEIHVVGRSHGKVQKGLKHAQLTTVEGGCLEGPKDPCHDIFFSIFAPVAVKPKPKEEAKPAPEKAAEKEVVNEVVQPAPQKEKAEPAPTDETLPFPDLDPMTSISALRWFDTGKPVSEGARTELSRTKDAAWVHAYIQKLPPGHALTLWAVVFEHPEKCDGADAKNPDPPFNVLAVGQPGCGEDDVIRAFTGADNDIDLTVTFAAGGVTDANGKLVTWGKVGGGFTLIGDGKLDHPKTAEIHFVVRSHGPDQPGDLDTTTAPGGCQGEDLPPGVVPMKQGECGDVFFSIHLP